MALPFASNDKVNILGSYISVWNLSETVDQLSRFVKNGQRAYVCVSNVHTVVMGMQDPDFAFVTNQATLATADGVPLVWASRTLGGPSIHGRASGPDILEKLLQQSDQYPLRHFFYGSTPEVLVELERKLKERFPRAQCVGFLSPPIRKAANFNSEMSEEEKNECAQIDQVRPDIVWVGLGAPKQEIWMHRARQVIQAPVLIGVGAAFDFLSDNKKRAPLWMQTFGLEWFYRLCQEPQRLLARYFFTNPVFVFEVLKKSISRLIFKDERSSS